MACLQVVAPPLSDAKKMGLIEVLNQMKDINKKRNRDAGRLAIYLTFPSRLGAYTRMVVPRRGIFSHQS